MDNIPDVNSAYFCACYTKFNTSLFNDFLHVQHYLDSCQVVTDLHLLNIYTFSGLKCQAELSTTTEKIVTRPSKFNLSGICL